MNRPEVILVTILGILILPFIFFLPERASTALIGFSFIAVICEKQVRTNRRLLAAVMLSLIAHQVASLINMYYMLLMGADVDAIGFHEAAKAMARSLQPNWFAEFGNMDAGASIYIRFLAFFYYLFGDSKLLGQSLSVFAYTLSCLFIVKLSQQMGLRRWQVGLMCLYGLLPSAILFPTFTLREAYQIFFFLASIYWTLRLRRNPSISSMVLIVLAGVSLGLLHNGLVIYSLILICFNFLWALRFGMKRGRVKSLGIKTVGISLLFGTIITWVFFASNFGSATRALMAGEGMEYAGGYREKAGLDERAAYGGKLDTSSLSSFVPSAASVFVLYMFAPFPWQIRSPIDIYAVFEALLRFLLLYQALATWYRARGERRSQWGYVILCFLSLEFLWATGTANWGTAIRHHLVAYGLLVLAGGPGLLSNLMHIFLRLTKWKRSRQRRFITAQAFLTTAGGNTKLPLTSPSNVANSLKK